jgi:hypothetical protein
VIAAYALYEVAFSEPSASADLPDFRFPPSYYAETVRKNLVSAMMQGSDSLLPTLDEFTAHPPPDPKQDDVPLTD